MVALSIIIVTYNSSKFIASCLNSINDETLKQGFEVIVVDNASTDDTVSIVKQYPEVILIENKANLGYSKANNIGHYLILLPKYFSYNSLLLDLLPYYELQIHGDIKSNRVSIRISNFYLLLLGTNQHH